MQKLIEVMYATIEATEVNLTNPQQRNFAQNGLFIASSILGLVIFSILLCQIYSRQQINDIIYSKSSRLQSSQVQWDVSVKILIWDGYIKTTKTPEKFNRIAFWPSLSKQTFLQLCKTNQLHSIWIMSPCLYWGTLELLPINNMFDFIQNHITFPFW